jgi:hypothetical protein
MASRVEIDDVDRGVAFGESLGIEVPTRYGRDTHAAFSTILAVDSLLTPLILGMSRRTVMLCQLLAGGLLWLRREDSDLTLRQRLQIEAAAGLVLLVLALRGTITRRLLDRLYLFIGGVLIIANSLMTETD